MATGTIEVTNLYITDHDFTMTLNVHNVQIDSHSPWCEWIKLNKCKVQFRYYVFEVNYESYYTLYCYVLRETSDTDNVKLNGLRISVKMDDQDVQTYITSYNIKKKVAVLDDVRCTITVSDTQSNCNFKTMYDDESLLDFKLAVKGSNEGSGEESVGFHRAILAAWSPVMKTMFSNSWKEKNEGVLELPLKLEVIKAFKKYVYTDELPEDRETLLGLVELGSYFMDPKFEASASKRILKLITPDEICEMIVYSGAKKLNILLSLLLMKVRNYGIAEIDQAVDKIKKV